MGSAEDVSDKMESFLAYIAGGSPSSELTVQLENAVQKARDHIQWRKEYMTFLEQLEKEFREGYNKGREEERANTDRERQRADSAEAELERLKKLLSSHGIEDTE